MRVLVTGASGFIGSRVCTHLEKSGHEVIRVSRAIRSTSQSTRRNEYNLDIANPDTFENIEHAGGIDAIVHCAGLAHRFGKTSREDFLRVNVKGARNVAEFAVRNGIGRFVHLSSVLVYGTPMSNRPVSEAQRPDPKDHYAWSKFAGEMAVAEACESTHIKLAILRPVPVIGEGSQGNVARLIDAIDRGRFLWIGDGRNERSFVYVDDVAAATVVALSLREESVVLNVTGGAITVRELVETISKHLGRPRPFSLIPHRFSRIAMRIFTPLAQLPWLGRYYRTVETWLADAVYSGEAFTNLGFIPKTSIREGLRREVESYTSKR